ncbi:hypothetical protein [Natrarchaeobius chitinivorans]|uniref:Uncharacterized protein n=1 Tax=Natrarchaeobius chitinivorans TaxID=1679083 RepID=A0A3N6M3D6_NATCH|nr:hypothetical protein [Natrarchaeobius chitinivorans]RQG89711.1 hypothetical protein EA473_21565 [Natrarchaeobius chitinivorans]
MCDSCGRRDHSAVFADLYLEARFERGTADTEAVPREELAPVFDAHGWGEVVPHLGGDDWIVWTPDGCEMPLYIYTPTLVEDTTTERDRFAALLATAGVGTERFIEVLDGQKASFDTDNRREPADPELAGNYGVKGGCGGNGEGGRWLVAIDVDDYEEATENHDQIEKLHAETLAVASAHTTVDRPGHLYVAVDGDPTAVVNDVLGRPVANPVASFGEIRVENQYCVGPGSEIVCNCDQCTPADADVHHGIGRYELATEQPPVVWTENEFREFLLADPAIRRETAAVEKCADPRDSVATTSTSGSRRPNDGSSRRDETLDDDPKERFDRAASVDPAVREALERLEDPADRSKADALFASAIAPWVDHDEDALRGLLDEHGAKWQTRPDESYRGSIVDYARRTAQRKVTSALPLGALEALEPAEQRRYLKTRGVDWPSSAEVTDRIRDAVLETMADEGYRVVEAPTGANKTGIATETPWTDLADTVTGGRPVVLFCETTAARAEAIDRAEQAGLDPLVLRGRTELCAVAAGEYDPATVDEDDPDAPEPIVLEGRPASEWFDTMCDERGIAFSVAHAEAEDLLARQGRQCPCCEGESRCAATVQWPSDGLVDDDGVPRYDLVIATDPFAFVPSLRTNTNIIHDEQPDYTEEFGLEEARPETITPRVTRAVTAFLGLSQAGPDTYEELVTLARECAACEAVPWNEHAAPAETPSADLAERWFATFDALEHEPARQWYFGDTRAHTLAPALARAIWKAIVNGGRSGSPDSGPFDQNGRASATVRHEPPRLDNDSRDGDGWNRTYVTVVVDETNQIRRVRNAPDMSTARAVVGLDARPTAWLWQRNVHPDLTVDPVLEPTERRHWRRFERRQIGVQVGDATRPAGTNGRYFTPHHARALLETLCEYSEDFRAVGCPLAFEEPLRELMRDAGVPDDDLASLHYGEEKSRNEFAAEALGLVYGCIDPGDDYVLDWLAECGLDAAPERSASACGDCSGEGCHACDGTGYRRAYGRGFVGPDADHAVELLESVRATHVAQMVGRFGRDLEAGEWNITFVATDAVPPDLVDYHVEGVVSVATDLQREIITELETRPSATTRELAAAVGCDKEHVRQTLADYESRDGTGVRRGRGIGEHGADVWRRRSTGSDFMRILFKPLVGERTRRG